MDISKNMSEFIDTVDRFSTALLDDDATDAAEGLRFIDVRSQSSPSFDKTDIIPRNKTAISEFVAEEGNVPGGIPAMRLIV